MTSILDFTTEVLSETLSLLIDASPYMLFGILMAGLLKMFLSTDFIGQNLGEGRFKPVFKAALLGIPIPLCSCGVLPAAASLRKQGASRGATTAFLISTPESGVDSIAVSWALLDPIMTVARPVAAFVTAFTAGIAENLLGQSKQDEQIVVDRSCAIDGCCDGMDCDPADHANHHTLVEKLSGGLRYAFGELWGDLASWFAAGLLLAGIITVLVPDAMMTAYLGGGLTSMLLMLLIGVPLYICATASTPVAAALILKGVSPGAALVFLLVGPATNMASLSVLVGLLGKRSTAIYLGAVASVSVLAGLLLDGVYNLSGISVKAVMGQAAQIIPGPMQIFCTLIIVAISIRPVAVSVINRFDGWGKRSDSAATTKCGCMDDCEPVEG
jgi:uncharacterized membrane protein YraQ (UPF0718 family)